MKKNLMQTNGVLGRGSRYQPGGAVAVNVQSPISDENFDDQFFQLDHTVNNTNTVDTGSPNKDDDKDGLNALE